MIFNLSMHEGTFDEIKIHYNKTKLSETLIVYATRFVYIHNSKEVCFWNNRFLQTKNKIPKDFCGQLLNKVLSSVEMDSPVLNRDFVVPPHKNFL